MKKYTFVAFLFILMGLFFASCNRQNKVVEHELNTETYQKDFDELNNRIAEFENIFVLDNLETRAGLEKTGLDYWSRCPWRGNGFPWRTGLINPSFCWLLNCRGLLGNDCCE